VILTVLALVLLACVFYFGKTHNPSSSSQETREEAKPEAKTEPQTIENKRTTHSALADGIDVVTTSEKPSDPTAPWIETVSWSPRVFVYHNFLTQDECKKILDLAQADVSRSMVVGATGKATVSQARSSSGVFLVEKYMRASAVLRDTERRIADWTQIPIENGEAYYLLRYEEGQEYKPHTDWFSNDENGKVHIGTQGNRIATVLTYLHSPDEGGETIFPEAQKSVPAKAGDAVLFWDLTPNNDPDPRSLHGGKPVIKGIKWAMTKWIRENKAAYRWEAYLSKEELLRLKKEDEAFAKNKTMQLQIN